MLVLLLLLFASDAGAEDALMFLETPNMAMDDQVRGETTTPKSVRSQEEGQVLGINLGPVNTCVDHLLYLIGVRTFGESSKMTNA